MSHATVFTPFALPPLPEIPERTVDIRNHGAVPGGRALNTAAIAAAIAAVAEDGGGRVVIPAGVWLTGAVHLRSRVELHLAEGAELRFSQDPADYLPVVLSQRGGIMLYNYSPFLYAQGCHDIAITGKGVLNGQGQSWWPWKYREPGMTRVMVDIPEKGIPLEERVFGTREAGVRPVFCQPIECDRVRIEGVTFRDSPSWTLQPVWCRDLTVRGVTILNPPSPLSTNTDGIDPDACRNVLIEHCTVNTGDDAICLKAGRGPDAWKDGRPCENVLIRHCRIFHGHGGITIGSEMSAGVRNVHAHDCELDGTDRGIRIKSKPSRGGFVENILVERIRMRRMQAYAIDINLHYEGNREETLDLETLRDVPRFERIAIRDVACESAARAVNLQGLPGHPLKGISLKEVAIRAGEGATIDEVEDLAVEGLRLARLASRASLHGDLPSKAVRDARHVAGVIEAPDVAFPAGKRPMAGRRAAAILPPDAGPPLVLRWASGNGAEGPARLRFTAAVDQRCMHRVAAANAATGAPLGEIDVRFACPGEVFELPLATEQAAAAVRGGVALSLAEAVEPLWGVIQGPNAPEAVQPQLFFGADRPATPSDFLALFCSEASIQPCDWMEICVLDGLCDWAARGRIGALHAARRHLDVFFHPETGRRENMRGEPFDGGPGGPETTGPFAVLARLARQHPALSLAEQGFEKQYCPETDSVGHRVAAETSYNIAYPMMALAVFAGREQWRERALRQLEANREYLVGPDDLWLRYFPKTGERTFRGWSRGVAWYYLGLVRTLSLLPAHERPSSLAGEVDRMAEWVARYQREDGLWPCFLREPDTGPDTSGSAGIAAAVAVALRHGMLDRAHGATALRARAGLMARLTPDGWLRGVSQSNKRETEGMDLQRSRWRVIAPWGMGLLAQLLAALPDPG